MKKYPEHVVVAGGGRWARVLISVLYDLLPQSVPVTIYSPHGAASMAEWVVSQGFQGRVSVSSDWPNFSPELTHAMVIANAARDHFKVAKRALESRIPVLVEKPVALSFREVEELVQISQVNKVPLAPAHVFLFAYFIEKFSAYVTDMGKIIRIKVLWSDPKCEQRHGEQKQFDPSLPIYVDWIPHILSVLSMFIPFQNSECKKVRLLEGGRQVDMVLESAGCKCDIELVRNGDSRKRMIEVETDSDRFTLDFSVEPGFAYSAVSSLPEDIATLKKGNQGPVSRMLDTFLRWAVSGEDDSRFDIGLGLQANRLIEQVASRYQGLQKAWLYKALATYDRRDENLQYTLAEILQANGNYSQDTLGRMLRMVESAFSGGGREIWLNKFNKADDYGQFIRNIATGM
ncbi:MAG TPA: Gfo/Idh/MocA family oxidoreductase [Balneolales bacterium]|nr:Gfo/Idh/MocA family oxidoreductase [Balneolales bacterium]